jgi:hypothetical protein
MSADYIYSEWRRKGRKGCVGWMHGLMHGFCKGKGRRGICGPVVVDDEVVLEQEQEEEEQQQEEEEEEEVVVVVVLVVDKGGKKF